MLDTLKSLFAGPSAVERSDEEQRRIDGETAGWSLYYYDGCLFCSRVIRAIEQLGLRIERRDVLRQPRHRQALVAGGGRATVPCLRIPGGGEEGDRWMYESAGIVAFLRLRFAPREDGS